MSTIVAGMLVKGTRILVPGVVYCLQHTTVHDDSELPYGAGDWCPKHEHRLVYAGMRAGDPAEVG